MIHKVRVVTAQHHMYQISSWWKIEDQVSCIMGYAKQAQSQLLLLPEYFCIHYMNCLPEGWSDIEKFNAVVDKYDQYIKMLSSLTIQQNLFIIGGSHPVRRVDGTLSNTAYLFSPSGSVFTQEKLHVTPKEKTIWEYSGIFA